MHFRKTAPLRPLGSQPSLVAHLLGQLTEPRRDQHGRVNEPRNQITMYLALTLASFQHFYNFLSHRKNLTKSRICIPCPPWPTCRHSCRGSLPPWRTGSWRGCPHTGPSRSRSSCAAGRRTVGTRRPGTGRHLGHHLHLLLLKLNLLLEVSSCSTSTSAWTNRTFGQIAKQNLRFLEGRSTG